MIRFVFSIFFSFILYSQELPVDYLTPDFHFERRNEVRKMMPNNSVAVYFSNPVRNRANDVNYHYHQDPNFYYLTGLKEPNSLLLIFKDSQYIDNIETNEILFVQERNPSKEQWDGYRLGVSGAKKKLKVNHVMYNSDFKNLKIDFGLFYKVLFFNFHNDIRDDISNPNDLFSLIEDFKDKIKYSDDYSSEKNSIYRYIVTSTPKSTANVSQILDRISRDNKNLKNDLLLNQLMNAKNNSQITEITKKISQSILNIDTKTLPQIMDKLREVKHAEEIVLLKKAIFISAVGQVEVMKAMHPEMSEREIQGIHEFVFKKYNSEYEGYPSIVGSGHNGCVLHYINNDKPRVGNDLVLMDLGAEYHNYTADVTRTIPANGKFTENQKKIYQIVFDAQEAGIKASVVGATMSSVHKTSFDVIEKGLKRLGIIKEKSEVKKYFPHGTSHYLGLDVHDAGTYNPFKHNTLITVEPGIYIPENSPCDPKWWGIAIRIEDDILITENGPINLSSFAPRKLDEIEKVMSERSVLDSFVLPELDF